MWKASLRVRIRQNLHDNNTISKHAGVLEQQYSVRKMPFTLSDAYVDLTQHIVPGPASISYFIPIILLPTALLIPPSILSHRATAFLFLPAIYACLAHAWLCIGGVDVISIDVALWSLLLLALRDPRQTHRRLWVREGGNIRDEKVPQDKRGEMTKVVEEPYPETLSKRVPWVFTLLVSLRLAGWKIGEPSHDKSQPPKRMSRIAFLKHAMAINVTSYVLLDLAAAYVQTDSYFTTSHMSVDAPFPPLAGQMHQSLHLLRLLPPRLVRASVLAAQIYAIVTSLFYLGTPMAVGLNALRSIPDQWSPHTWPLFLGKFSEVWDRGLRGLWGKWWHHNNRQVTATPGRALAQAMGVKTSSTLGFGMLATSAFFFSGVLHMGLIPPYPRSNVLTSFEMKLYVGGFFWAQLPAFAIEVAVASFLARFAPDVPGWKLSKVVILVWTAAWLCLTFPLLTPPFRELGYWTRYPIPISVVQGLSSGHWRTW